MYAIMKVLTVLISLLLTHASIVFAFLISDSQRTSSASGRIIGGQVASVGQFPYQVALRAKIIDYDPFVEGAGALISKNYVLTVGHAVEIPGILYINLHLGVHEVDNPDEPRKIITVNKDGFTVHENFYLAEIYVQYDIALLKLPEPVEFTDKIQPIALPTRADAMVDMEGSYLRAAGWGRYTDANRNVSQYLQYTDLQVFNQKICYHYYHYLLPSMICTYTGFGSGTCQGDSGGALVYTDPKTKRKFVAGLASFGFFTCVEDGWPGVHTRVTYFLDWIAAHTDIEII